MTAIRTVIVGVAFIGATLLLTQAAPAAPSATRKLGSVGRGDGVAADMPTSETRATTDAGRARACAAGMVEVKGSYCARLEQTCVKWIGKDGKKQDRCAEYAPGTRCLDAPGATRAKHFCIDQHEYPNKVGEKPVVAVTWEEARDTCASVGKRLCGSEEWTVACEGPEHLPYPTGYTRDKNACNVDKPYIVPNNAKYSNLATRAEEVTRVDQRAPSGANQACVSAYGAFDMVGNVDEWVVNERGSANQAPYRSGLKGGYWGPVRNRCRPMTTAHNQWHSGYQVGFRCCSDAK
jgi:formylglycine-generating enzyme required for sulfatase activity